MAHMKTLSFFTTMPKKLLFENVKAGAVVFFLLIISENEVRQSGFINQIGFSV
jgi:hypothetical protein